jgi:hypothetical protein
MTSDVYYVFEHYEEWDEAIMTILDSDGQIIKIIGIMGLHNYHLN